MVCIIFMPLSVLLQVSATAADTETTLTLLASPHLILLCMHFIYRHIIYQIGHSSFKFANVTQGEVHSNVVSI